MSDINPTNNVFLDPDNMPLDQKLTLEYGPNYLPIDGFIDFIRQYIEDVSKAYGCPEAFVTIAVLSAASAAIGNGIHVRFKTYDNPLMLWMVNIAPSGSNKTSPVRYVLRPLYNIDKEEYQRFKDETNAWRLAGTPGSEKPRSRQLIINDTTDEARNKALEANPHGLMTYQPEFKAFFDDLGRYSGSGSETSRLLNLFDGNPIHINRKADDFRTIIESPFMTILGDIQPGLLKECFGSHQFQVSGLCQRFLFYMIDRNSLMPALFSDVSPDADLQRMWENDIIRALYYFPWDSIKEPLTLSDEATAIYGDYYNLKEAAKLTAENDYLGSLYAKMQIHVLRIAAVVHIINWIPTRDSRAMDQIYAEDMDYAVRVANFFERNALSVYDAIKEDKSPLEGKSLAQIIREFHRVIPIVDRQAFAKGIGCNMSTVYKAVPVNN